MALRTVAVALACLLGTAGAWAVTAAPLETLLTQADDGSTFWARHGGDEYIAWTETLDGYTIVEDQGVWYYAVQDPSGELTSSGLRANSATRAAVQGLEKHLRPPLDPGIVEENELRKLGPLGARTLAGTQNILMILVDFSDITFQYSDSSFQDLMFGNSNTVKKFYLENTYNNFLLVPAAETYDVANDGVVHVTIGTPNPNYGGACGCSWNTVVGTYLSSADPYVNFAAFDTNSDGALSPSELSIVFVLAGYENSYGGSSSLQPRIWAHKSTMSPAPILDGVTLGPYAAFGERHATSLANEHQATIGVMCHELGHLMFGLPDLYDTDGSSEGIGDWGLMGGGSWNATIQWSGDTPSHLSAWSKVALGIVTPDDVDNSFYDLSVKQGDNNPSIKRVWIDPYKVSTSEYYLVENRQLANYDAGLDGDGLLIWHVDGSKLSNALDTQRLVDLEEADGFNDLDVGINQGDTGDPFPGATNNTAFYNGSNPNSKDNQGVATHIGVTNISSSAATMWSDFAVPPKIFGGEVSYMDTGSYTSWGYNDPTAWTAVRFTNDTSIETIEGFEIYVTDDTATIDFSLYESINGGFLSNLLHTETGFNGVRGWNRFTLASPQSFPAGSDRVMVLKIVNAAFGYPAASEKSGPNSGRAYLDSNGLGIFGTFEHDLQQRLLLRVPGKAAIVYVNFDWSGGESGTQANPFNTFYEGLAHVTDSGTIRLNGNAAATSSWTGVVDTPVTLQASPQGSVVIGN